MLSKKQCICKVFSQEPRISMFWAARVSSGTKIRVSWGLAVPIFFKFDPNYSSMIVQSFNVRGFWGLGETCQYNYKLFIILQKRQLFSILKLISSVLKFLVFDFHPLRPRDFCASNLEISTHYASVGNQIIKFWAIFCSRQGHCTETLNLSGLVLDAILISKSKQTHNGYKFQDLMHRNFCTVMGRSQTRKISKQMK